MLTDSPPVSAPPAPSARASTTLPRSLVRRLFCWFAFGLMLRLKPTSFDRGQPWDEIYYVPAVRQILNHQKLLTDHPPLGKAMLALGSLVNPLTGSRILVMAVGALLPVLAALIIFQLTRRQRPALIGATLITLDTYLLTESRYALLNPLLCGLLLLTLLAVLQPRWLFRCLGTGLLAGFAAGVKWTIAPILPVLLVLQRRWQSALVMLLATGLGYYLACAPVTRLNPFSFGSYQQELLTYHQTIGRHKTVDQEVRKRFESLRKADNNGVRTAAALRQATPYGRILDWVYRRTPIRLDGTAPFYLWPLGNMQLYAWSGASKLQLCLGAISNPAIWLGSLVGGLRILREARYRWLGFGFLACWLPWAFVSRPLYPYTYEPALLLGLIALALQLDQGLTEGPRSRRLLIWGYLLIAALFTVSYLPFSLGFGLVKLP